MMALFADLPAALANSVEIARRCAVTLRLGNPQLPIYPTPEGVSIEEYLVHQAEDGLARRLERLYPDPEVRAQKTPEYEARLKRECETIIKMGFPGYFLIVADFIVWAKQNGVPVGPEKVTARRGTQDGTVLGTAGHVRGGGGVGVGGGGDHAHVDRGGVGAAQTQATGV